MAGMGLGFLCIAEGRGEGEGENKREGADGRSDGWEHQIIKRKEKGYVPSLGEVETAGMWESHSFFFFFLGTMRLQASSLVPPLLNKGNKTCG